MGFHSELHSERQSNIRKKFKSVKTTSTRDAGTGGGGRRRGGQER